MDNKLAQSTTSVVRVNNLIEVLSDLKPGYVSEFKTTYPELSGLLVKGVTLGGKETRNDFQNLFVLAENALSEVQKHLPVIFGVLSKKLIWIRRLRTGGAFVSIIASAGIIAAVYGQSQVAAIVTAVITAISSAFTVLANSAEGSLLSGKAGSAEQFVQLLQIDRRIFELNQTIILAHAAGDNTREQVLEIVNSANSAAAEFRQLKMSLKIWHMF